MIKIECPSCFAETGVSKFEDGKIYFCSNCGGKLVISVKCVNPSAIRNSEKLFDEMFYIAAVLCIKAKKASPFSLSSSLKIDYHRASKIIHSLIEEGIIEASETYDNYPVLMSKNEFDKYMINTYGEDFSELLVLN